MSPRYYLISGIVVVVLTMVISWWRGKRSIKEVFIVCCQVILLLFMLVFALVGLVEFLVYLGIAQNGFIIQGEKLK